MGDVPSVSVVVFQLNVISVSDHVVLCGSVVVCWVCVTATVNAVPANLEVVFREVGRQVDLVCLPTSVFTGKQSAAVNGRQGHTTVHVNTNGVVGCGESINLRSAVVGLDTNCSVLYDDVFDGTSRCFNPECGTGLSGVNDARICDVHSSAINLDGSHF